MTTLRADVPVYDTPELAAQWQRALEITTQLGELTHPCSMGVDIRRLLFQTVRAMGAKSVLDIGTFTGTSAFNYALAVGEDGSVVTVDIEDVNAPSAYWSEWGRPRSPDALMHAAGVAHRVTFVTQDAREYLGAPGPTFDFISIDGWHEDHAVYKEVSLALERLNPNGLIFLDDVQPPGYTPPPGCDVIRGPWVALQQHLAEGAQFKLTLIPQTATAFLLRK